MKMQFFVSVNFSQLVSARVHNLICQTTIWNSILFFIHLLRRFLQFSFFIFATFHKIIINCSKSAILPKAVRVFCGREKQKKEFFIYFWVFIFQLDSSLSWKFATILFILHYAFFPPSVCLITFQIFLWPLE